MLGVCHNICINLQGKPYQTSVKGITRIKINQQGRLPDLFKQTEIRIFFRLSHFFITPKENFEKSIGVCAPTVPMLQTPLFLTKLVKKQKTY